MGRLVSLSRGVTRPAPHECIHNLARVALYAWVLADAPMHHTCSSTSARPRAQGVGTQSGARKATADHKRRLRGGTIERVSEPIEPKRCAPRPPAQADDCTPNSCAPDSADSCAPDSCAHLGVGTEHPVRTTAPVSGLCASAAACCRGWLRPTAGAAGGATGGGGGARPPVTELAPCAGDSGAWGVRS